MAHFLLKPHVTGPEGDVTSPDVIVDKVFVDGHPTPVGRVTHAAWQEALEGETGTPGYAVMALGGGALLLPAVVLGSGAIVVARKAWRLNNLDAHIGDVTLNGVALAAIGLPSDLIEQAGGSGDTLPRGFLLVRTSGSTAFHAELADPGRKRVLSHKVVVEDVSADLWAGDRPSPRYSVGPTQKEVRHFI